MLNNSSIDKLRNWFYSFANAKEKNEPFWVLYRGQQGINERSKVIYNFDISDIDASWQALINAIEGQWHVTQQFTIVYKSAKNDPSMSNFILKDEADTSKIGKIGSMPDGDYLERLMTSKIEGVRMENTLEIMKLKHEQELENLRREMDDLKEKPVISKIGKIVETSIGKLLENPTIMGILGRKLLGEDGAQIGMMMSNNFHEEEEEEEKETTNLHETQDNTTPNYNLPNYLYLHLIEKKGVLVTNDLFIKLINLVQDDTKLDYLLTLSKSL